MAPSPERGLVAVLAAALLGACTPDPLDEPPAPPDDRDLAALQAWLAAGEYLAWERHDPPPSPDSPGASRVYLSPALAESLRSGAESHPVGAAAVREILDATDPELHLGFAYIYKVEPAVDPEAWFFYEVFDLGPEGQALVAERGAPGCVGCHSEGVDFVRSQL